MATVTIDNVRQIPQESNCVAPYGNLSALKFRYAVNASGIMTNSDKATAIADGDVVRLGTLPAGLELIDMVRIISDAFAGSTTDKIGFKYVDGVDSAAVPEDDDYFSGATTSAATAITRKTAVTAPVTLPKDAYLILTRAGAADSAVGIMDIIIIGILKGAV
jgi:hypothetical protein